MPTVRTLDKSFSSGEITPELFGRVDLLKFQSGLAACRNFLVMPHGPVRNRTGTKFVKQVRNPLFKTRLIPFNYTNVQTFSVEIGVGYVRWHTQAATLQTGALMPWVVGTAYNIGDLVTNGGLPYYCVAANTGQAPPNATYWYAMPADGTYEIPNPYVDGELFDIHYTQSADVLTLVHPNHPAMELRRYGATNWQLAAIVWSPTQAAPPSGSCAATVAVGGTPITESYAVCAVAASGASSLATLCGNCSNDLTVAGNYNTVNWTAAPNAQRYNVFKSSNGLMGYIGQTNGLSFVDDNIEADISQSTPLIDTTFTAPGGPGYYPAAVGYFQQRRFFAGWTEDPQGILGTRSGTENDVSYHIPSLSDDRLLFTVAAREASSIRHIVPVQALILLTATNEFRMASTDGGAITALTTDVTPQAYVGANTVQPVIVGSTLLYPQSRGGHLREMSYNWQAQSYLTNDISLMAAHLFDYEDILDMAFCRAPQPIVWCVSTTGQLLAMTYVPEQQISAWHRHDTPGVFESCCAVTENGEDILYVVVQRTINGETTRYVECLSTRNFPTPADSFFVDSGATYSGAPTTTITGLTWLIGETVNILGDGAVMPPVVVDNTGP